MNVIEIRHIQRTIEFLNEKAAEYLESAEQYSDCDSLQHLAGWYKGRGEGFKSAAEYLETDLMIYTEELGQ